MKLEKIFEEFAPMTKEDHGQANVVYADAIRKMAKTQEQKDEAQKVAETPKTETPEVVKTDDLKKMHLSESLFDNYYELDEDFDALEEKINFADIVYDELSRIIGGVGSDGRPRHLEVYANPLGHGYKIENDTMKGLDKAVEIAKKHNLDYTLTPFRDYYRFTIDIPERD